MRKLLLASALLLALPFTPAKADPFTASCSGGGTTLTCTFVSAAPGELFVDSQVSDINLTAGSVLTAETESFVFNGTTSTNSSIDISRVNDVGGFGHFSVEDNLLTSPPRATTVTLTLTGSNLALAPNELGNTFAAHIGTGCTLPSGACTSTLFATPTTVSVPGPIIGAGIPGIVLGCLSLIGLARRRISRLRDMGMASAF